MKSVLTLLFFLLPLVWSKYLNANYLSAKTFLLYFSSSLALLALPNELVLRKIPKSIWILLVLVFGYNVGYHFLDFEPSSLFYLFKFLSFAFVSLYIYSLNLDIESFFKKFSYEFFGLWALIAGFTGYEIFNLRVLESNIQTGVILSTFGNINMFLEFAILSLPVLFYWSRFSDKVPTWLKCFLLSTVTFFILYGRSRSAYIGLIVWLIFKTLRGLKTREWIAFASAVVVFAVSHFTAPNSEVISKVESFSERVSLYEGSLQLLADHPLGIGVGQFVNEIVPYLIDKKQPTNEYAYFDQPHSEFLKWGIQFGWPMLVLSLALFAVLFINTFRSFRSEGNGTGLGRSLFFEIMIMLTPQALFQFPFENPATLLFLGVVLGLFLSDFAEVFKIKTKFFIPLTGALALAGIVNSFLFLSSIAFESLYPKSADLMDIACSMYPSNFRTCYWKNKDLLDLKNIPAFQAHFKKDYLKNPFFCDNLRLLPEFFNYQKNEQKTCEALLLYSFIYKNQKHFTDATMSNCARYSMPFKYENPLQFDTEFRKWFSR